MKDITFSINLYDYEGDVFSECILLHIGKDFILKVDRKNGIREMIEQLEKIDAEIVNNYPRVD